MSRWKCICAYDGGSFAGWQSQANGRGVQDALEARLAQVLGTGARIHGSGRTDAGVHARAQAFHFDAPWGHGPDKLAAALRHRLPPAIQIVSVRKAAPEFHARFSATGKIYHYHICLGDADPFTRPYCWSFGRPLDLPALSKAASLLQGRHDFRSFSAANGGEEEGGAGGTVRTLRRLEVAAKGRRLRIAAEADGFLYKMVRRLVGALVGAGEGKLSADDFRSLLASGERTAVIQTAPPQGLFLHKVLYR
jgi:tRNA pseudouridine38-40 synthase